MIRSESRRSPPGVFPTEWGDELHVEVVGVAGGEGLNPLPGNRFVAAELLRRGEQITIAAVATAAVIFLLRGRQRIQTRISAKTSDEGGAGRQVFEDGAICETTVGTDQQRALRPGREFIEAVAQSDDALSATATEGGSGGRVTPGMPLGGISAT